LQIAKQKSLLQSPSLGILSQKQFYDIFLCFLDFIHPLQVSVFPLKASFAKPPQTRPSPKNTNVNAAKVSIQFTLDGGFNLKDGTRPA
jgi:hypothetical protein